MMWHSFAVLLLANVCLSQHRHPGDRQIRLEDIERDNLAANPKTSALVQSQPALNHQQLAAYQQQLLLQQLQQQQYFAYNGLGGAVPLMIIPSNHLGVGSPIQAYFIPTDTQLVNHVYHQIPETQRYTQPQRVQSAHQLSPFPQEFTYIQPQQSYNRALSSAGVTHAGAPSTNYQQQQIYQPQQQYDAYNALYQQQQNKNSFTVGVKSTPSPSTKPNSPQVPNQVYSNYK